jgi:hypothetical protein
MEKMTKKEKFKKFVDDHHETIAKVAVYATIIVSSIAIIARTVSKEEQERIDKIDRYNEWTDGENEWLQEKLAEGNDAYILHDLTYMFIPKDTKREFVEDRLNGVYNAIKLK